MESLKLAMIDSENVYLRGFGTFHQQKRVETGRNILAKTTIFIHELFVTFFRPFPEFKEEDRNPKK